MSQQEKRQLKIKTGMVQRISKELKYYEEEWKREQKRVDKLRADGADAHDLQQAENVLAESKAMVPDTQQRLESAVAELKRFLGELGDKMEGTEELVSAKRVLVD